MAGDQEPEPQQMDFDKSSTIPRNSDISHSYRQMFQSKRPASTAGLPSTQVANPSQGAYSTLPYPSTPLHTGAYPPLSAGTQWSIYLVFTSSKHIACIRLKSVLFVFRCTVGSYSRCRLRSWLPLWVQLWLLFYRPRTSYSHPWGCHNTPHPFLKAVCSTFSLSWGHRPHPNSYTCHPSKNPCGAWRVRSNEWEQGSRSGGRRARRKPRVPNVRERQGRWHTANDVLEWPGYNKSTRPALVQSAALSKRSRTGGWRRVRRWHAGGYTQGSEAQEDSDKWPLSPTHCMITRSREGCRNELHPAVCMWV